MAAAGDHRAMYAEAVRLVRDRDLAGAEALLARLIAVEPGHHGALHLLGRLAGRARRDGECVAMLTRAAAAGTAAEAAASLALLAAAHERMGRDGDAEAAYRAALDRDPALADALLGLGHLLRRSGRGAGAAAIFARPHPPGHRADFRLGSGLCLGDAGDHEAAVAALREAIALRPGFAPAHGALAAALLALGDPDSARVEAGRALALAPDDPDAAGNLAVALNALGRHAEAATICRQALARGEEAGLRNTLGVALRENGAIDEAADCFARAVAIRPGFAAARLNLGSARKEQGRTDEATACFREAVALVPDLAAAHIALAMAPLPALCRDAAEAERRLGDYATGLDALAAADPAMLADGVGAAQPFLLPALAEDVVELQRRYGAIVVGATATRYAAAPSRPPRRPGERLRLGVVCGFLRDHSVWRVPTRGWIEAIDRDRFALTAYHTGSLRDVETGRAARLFDRVVERRHGIAGWRDAVAADRPHALLYPEIGMDPMAARLAAMRLAPVQYASWGHPVTSGYPTIDFYLSSDAMEPPDGDRHYTEDLMRLPGLSTPMLLPEVPAPASRRALGIDGAAVLFWCGQALHKYAPRHDGVFAAIAERVPGCRFLFVEPSGSAAIGRQFRDRLAAAGLDTAACHLLPRLDAAAYAAAMGCADIFLDSIGWSGCNTLLSAIACGLPVVTCPGATMRSRHAAAILETLGEGGAVCADVGAYIEAAAMLARDGDARRAMGGRLRARADRLADERPVRALEAHILAAVDAACAR